MITSKCTIVIKIENNKIEAMIDNKKVSYGMLICILELLKTKFVIEYINDDK